MAGIELFTAPTANGWKVSIALEECGLDYDTRYVHFANNEQKTPEFLALNPNGRIPVIVDNDNQGYVLAESGAILLYLADREGKLFPVEKNARFEATQWLMFQMGGVGPMFGQNGYFQGYCPEDVPVAKARYHKETKRLYGVLDKRLAKNEYLAGTEYSIADVATYPWTHPKQWELHRIDISEFPNVLRWNKVVSEREAVVRGIGLMADDQKVGNPDDETYRNMFGDAQYEKR